MKFVLILTVGLLFENFVLAQTEENTSRVKDLNIEKVKMVEELATPSSLLVNRPPLFGEFSSILLAPQYGTDVSITLNQSQVKFGRTSEKWKSSGSTNYSLGVLATEWFYLGNIYLGICLHLAGSSAKVYFFSRFNQIFNRVFFYGIIFHYRIRIGFCCYLGSGKKMGQSDSNWSHVFSNRFF